jgi:hypothetical protein
MQLILVDPAAELERLAEAQQQQLQGMTQEPHLQYAQSPQLALAQESSRRGGTTDTDRSNIAEQIVQEHPSEEIKDSEQAMSGGKNESKPEARHVVEIGMQAMRPAVEVAAAAFSSSPPPSVPTEFAGGRKGSVDETSNTVAATPAVIIRVHRTASDAAFLGNDVNPVTAHGFEVDTREQAKSNASRTSVRRGSDGIAAACTMHKDIPPPPAIDKPLQRMSVPGDYQIAINVTPASPTDVYQDAAAAMAKNDFLNFSPGPRRRVLSSSSKREHDRESALVEDRSIHQHTDKSQLESFAKRFVFYSPVCIPKKVMGCGSHFYGIFYRKRVHCKRMLSVN